MARRGAAGVCQVVLSYSRKAYSEAVMRQDTESFLAAWRMRFAAWGHAALAQCG